MARTVKLTMSVVETGRYGETYSYMYSGRKVADLGFSVLIPDGTTTRLDFRGADYANLLVLKPVNENCYLMLSTAAGATEIPMVKDRPTVLSAPDSAVTSAYIKNNSGSEVEVFVHLAGELG